MTKPDPAVSTDNYWNRNLKILSQTGGTELSSFGQKMTIGVSWRIQYFKKKKKEGGEGGVEETHYICKMKFWCKYLKSKKRYLLFLMFFLWLLLFCAVLGRKKSIHHDKIIPGKKEIGTAVWPIAFFCILKIVNLQLTRPVQKTARFWWQLLISGTSSEKRSLWNQTTENLLRAVHLRSL